MWHAARKQEQAIKSMMIDYRKRADRRRDFYEQMKQEPTNFLQLFGRPAKINLDPAVAAAAESPQIMQPWQGNTDVLIDRYDVRSHIDYIPAYAGNSEIGDISEEETRCNYERYRILVQNDSAGVTEDQCLQQIYMDEQFGAIPIPLECDNKKKGSEKKAAIGYSYDNEDLNSTNQKPAFKGRRNAKQEEEEDDDDDSSSDGDMDLDNILDIDLLTMDQEILLDKIALEYGLKVLRYSDFLEMDRSEMEEARMARLIEQEKAQYSGRKSRRERRIYKEKKMKDRQISPPSYAAQDSPKKGKKERDRGSTSRSRSPVVTVGKIEFITTFGNQAGAVGRHGDEDEDDGVVHGPFLPGTVDEEVLEEYLKWSGILPENPVQSISEATPPLTNKSKTKPTRRVSRLKSRSTSSSSKSRDTSASSTSRRSASRRSASRRSASRRRGKLNKSRSKRRRSSSASSSRSKRRRSKSRSRSKYRSRSKDRSRNKFRRSRSGSRNGRLKSNREKDDSRSKLDHRRKKKSVSTSSISINSSPSPVRIKRYRRPSLSSHSGLEDDDDEVGDEKKAQNNKVKNRLSQKYQRLVKADHSTTKTNPQEKLNRRIQLALSKHYKADKKAQIAKQSKEEQQKLEREEELRVISLQLRVRERDRRLKERDELDRLEHEWEKSHKSRSRSRERSRRRSYRRRSRTRSKSRSRGGQQQKKLVDY